MSQGTDSAPEPAGGHYRLLLEGKGIKVDREISEPVALQVIAAILGGQPLGPTSTKLAVRPIASSIGVGVPMPSLREFLDARKAKGNVEKIVVIAKYVTVQTGQETLTREDVKARFRTAGERPPANFARDFALAVTAGWIAEDHASRGDFYVTQTGNDALENEFRGDSRRSLAQARRPRPRSRKAANGSKAEGRVSEESR